MNKETETNDAKLPKWVHLALAGGPKRKLIIVQDDRFGYIAILEFPDLDLRIGKHASTPDHAFVLLESELERKRQTNPAVNYQKE